MRSEIVIPTKDLSALLPKDGKRSIVPLHSYIGGELGSYMSTTAGRLNALRVYGRFFVQVYAQMKDIEPDRITLALESPGIWETGDDDVVFYVDGKPDTQLGYRMMMEYALSEAMFQIYEASQQSTGSSAVQSYICVIDADGNIQASLHASEQDALDEIDEFVTENWPEGETMPSIAAERRDQYLEIFESERFFIVQTQAPGALRQEGDTDYVLLDDHQSVWVSVNGLSVYITRNDEGLSVDVFPKGDECADSFAGTWVLWSEVTGDPEVEIEE